MIEPGPAERARTLALGVVSGVLHLPALVTETGAGKAFRVQQLTAPDGSVALLVQNGSGLSDRLGAILRSSELADVPTVLDVLDVPPGQLCLPRARLCMTGWVEELSVPGQRQLAGAVAAARPVGALLDVGGGWTLYRLEIGEIRVTTGAGTRIVEPAEFAAAEPDPLYQDEDQVVGHLEEHHRDQTIEYAARRLAPTVVSDVTVVGLDRYGLDLLCTVCGQPASPTYRPLRAPFGCRVSDERSLSRALTRLLDNH